MKTLVQFWNGYEKANDRKVKINSLEFKKMRITWLLLNEEINEASVYAVASDKLWKHFIAELTGLLGDLSENAYQTALKFTA